MTSLSDVAGTYRGTSIHRLAPHDMRKMLPKVFVSLVALGALAVALTRGAEIQAGVVALVVIAALPWLASVVESVDLPGGGGIRLREIVNKVERQEQQLEVQQEVVTQLVMYSMSWYLFGLLSTIHHRSRSREEFLFQDNDGSRRDLRFLRDHGYLEHFTIADLRDGDNVIGKINLTPVGNFYVELRERLESQQATERARRLSDRSPSDG